MLSTSNIKNIGQAGQYFSEVDNYYTNEEGRAHSEWWGKGAEKLSLSGPVDSKQFTDLLKGLLPSGEQLGKMVNGEMQHRPGWDLTFSAPKSVSIMALVGGDTRLIEAHRQAVFEALSQVERSCSQARFQVSNEMRYQNTTNMVSAIYQHDLSRAKDPQLHTHCVTMNMTERIDGKWRSQASKLGRYDEAALGEINGFIERVNHHRRYFSKVYEAQLAYSVKQLGYEIRTNTKSGIFEIIGVPNEVLKQFSKRRSHIENHLDENGLSGGKAANVAALATRGAKEKVNRVELKEKWQIEAKRLGLDCEQMIANTYQKEKAQQNTVVSDRHILGAIVTAAKTLSVFQTTFTLEDLLTEAADYAIGHSIRFQSLLGAVDAQVQSGELISLQDEQGKTVFMAKATLEDEKRLSVSLSDQKLQKTIIESTLLSRTISKNNKIDKKQVENLKTIFNDDRIVILEGEKARHELIEPVMRIAKARDLEVVLLSPSLVGSKHLARESKLRSHSLLEQIKNIFIDNTPQHYSVMQFLAAPDHVKKRPDLLIVGNAQLLSTQQKANLVEWNKTHNTKLILLSSKHGLLSQKTGVGIDDITRHGIKTISIQTEHTQSAHDHAEIMRTALNKITGQIKEVKEPERRLSAMASHYCQLEESERRQSWLVAHHKSAVQQLNLLAHHELKEQNHLGKAAIVHVLIPVYLADGKAAMASSYQKGQVVRFNENYASLKVSRGEYLRVIRSAKLSSRVLLENERGDRTIWRPDLVAGSSSGKVEIFNEYQRELCVGETIQFHRSLYYQKIVCGERATITKVSSDHLKIRNDDGKIVTLDLSKPYHRHIDYGYAATPHSIAHTRPKTIIADLPSKGFLTDQRRFYQLVSQPNQAWIYTDDEKSLIAHLEKKTGNKITAHEAISQSEEIGRNTHSLYDVLSKQMTQLDGGTLSRPAVNAVEYAMNHLAEREAGFTHKQLMETAMQHAIGEVNQKSLMLAASEIEKAGLLLRGDRGDGTLWTTAEAVQIEREIVALCEQDKGKFQPIVNDSLLTQFCDENKLTSEQIAAVKAITQSQDRVLAIQGHPGTGKTTMLATVVDVLAAHSLLTKNGYELLGLAPTNVAVQELTNRGITSQTIDSFIWASQNALQNQSDLMKRPNLILVIDEASMVSNRKMLDVLQIAHALDCRAIPAGDARQLASPEAGKPHHLIQQTAVETSHLTQIRRQENPILIQAVKESIDFDFKAALMTLKESIIEVPLQPALDKERSNEEMFVSNRDERLSVLVKDFFSYPKDQREHIQIITPGHDDRVIANLKIREGLKQEGSLTAHDYPFGILKSQSMTQVERSHITNLSVGDVLRFGKRESNQIKAGEYLTIIELHNDNRLIKLKREDGKEVAWQVPQYDRKRLSRVEIFKREERALQAGDQIRWSRTNKPDELLSSQSAKIKSIEKNNITVELANKKTFTFDATNPKYQHWDHGYAATVYAVQGKTKAIILAHLESHRENLTTQSAFLVALTRAVNEFRLYTDNTERLLKRIEKNTGVKLSSLEVIGEYPSRKVKSDLTKDCTSTLLDVYAPSKIQRQDAPHHFSQGSIDLIKDGLNKDAEKLAITILGAPIERGGHYLKFGSNKGSLSVTTKGEAQGWFNDFETDKGGCDMIQFLQTYAGMDREEALRYGANWLGIVPNQLPTSVKIRTTEAAKSTTAKQGGFTEYQLERIKKANQLAHESVSINGTIAEKYLKIHRGIDMENIPRDIRFHPKIYCAINQKALPALLGIARDKDGKVQSVETIFLDPKTADVAIVKLQKQTVGPKKGAVVMLKQTQDPSAPTLIAEGVVTGLSVAMAIRNVNVAISLGKQMFASLDPKMLSEKVVFCLDNDGKKPTLDSTIQTASTRLKASKKEVSFMVPSGLAILKQDYNDILKRRGAEAIRRDFQKAIPYDDFYKPDGKVPTIKLEDPIKLPTNKIIMSVIRGENSRDLNGNRGQNGAVSDKFITTFAKEMTHKNDFSATEKQAIDGQLLSKDMAKPVKISKEIEREI